MKSKRNTPTTKRVDFCDMCHEIKTVFAVRDFEFNPYFYICNDCAKDHVAEITVCKGKDCGCFIPKGKELCSFCNLNEQIDKLKQ